MRKTVRNRKHTDSNKRRGRIVSALREVSLIVVFVERVVLQHVAGERRWEATMGGWWIR